MAVREETLDLLRRVGLFAELDDDELRRLGERFAEETVPGHRRLLRHGDDPDFFYVVREGEVAIFREEVGKPQQLLARLGPGDFFGETGLFEGYRASGAARASRPSRLLKIAKAELLRFLDDHPSVAFKLQMAAARRHSHNVAAALDLGLRQEVRIHLDKPVTLEPGFGAPRRARLENLSLGGLCLRGAPPGWQKGEEVGFRVRYFDLSLAVTGRICWREDDWVGVAFSDSGEDHDRDVQRLLRALLS